MLRALSGLGAAAVALERPAFGLAVVAARSEQCRPPERLRGISPPYLVHLAYPGSDELLFVAARHSLDQRSPTHSLIRHLMHVLRPASVILEGYFDDPARLLDQDRDLFRQNIQPENRYALALADTLGIHAVGGDLRPCWLARASVGHGYDLHDVIGSHIARILAGQPSEGRLLAVEAMVRRDLGELFPAKGFDFSAWYARRVGQAFSDAALRRDYRGPCGGGIIAEIISFESDTRNRNLIQRIATERRARARIAVVFGANHLYSVYGAIADQASKVEIITPGDLTSKIPRSAAPAASATRAGHPA